MAAVPIDHLEIGWLEVIEAVEVDRDVVAAELREVSFCEAVDAAVFAEVPPRDLSSPLVVAQVFATGEKAKGVRPDDSADDPELRADRTVAPIAADVRVEVDLETNRSAVTASNVRLFKASFGLLAGLRPDLRFGTALALAGDVRPPPLRLRRFDAASAIGHLHHGARRLRPRASRNR